MRGTPARCRERGRCTSAGPLPALEIAASLRSRTFERSPKPRSSRSPPRESCLRNARLPSLPSCSRSARPDPAGAGSRDRCNRFEACASSPRQPAESHPDSVRRRNPHPYPSCRAPWWRARRSSVDPSGSGRRFPPTPLGCIHWQCRGSSRRGRVRSRSSAKLPLQSPALRMSWCRGRRATR